MSLLITTKIYLPNVIGNYDWNNVNNNHIWFELFDIIMLLYHACDIPDTSHNKLFILKQQIIDDIHLATRQTFLISQHGQINTIKKNKKDDTHKDKKKPKKDKTPIVNIVNSPLTKNSEEKVTNHKPLCYKCKKLGHYQNNCVSDKKSYKLKTPYLHLEINSLKQKIKEIKISSFKIIEEQLTQEMVTLKI